MKIDGIAIMVNDETGEIKEVPATAELTLQEESLDQPTENRSDGLQLGYSRRYADSWERTFGKREVN